MVITNATNVIAVFEVGNWRLDVGMFDVNLFTNLCFSFGSSGTPTPTMSDSNFSNVFRLYLFESCGRTDVFAPT